MKGRLAAWAGSVHGKPLRMSHLAPKCLAGSGTASLQQQHIGPACSCRLCRCPVLLSAHRATTHLLPSTQAIKARVASNTRSDGRDEERPLITERNKDDILGEIRRLQAEMMKLEDRVQTSAKLMGGEQQGAGSGMTAAEPQQASDKSS